MHSSEETSLVGMIHLWVKVRRRHGAIFCMFDADLMAGKEEECFQ